MKKILLSLLTMFATATTTWADVAFNAINFPDENFRSYLQSLNYVTNGVITDATIARITYIGVNNKGIQSLKGIEYFTALQNLTYYDNEPSMTSVDLSKNTALTFLSIGGTLMTSLDLSKNTALKSLYCDSNQLTSLDVSGCTSLTTLSCFNNQLTSLDLSSNTALERLDCYQNQIKDEGMDALVASLPFRSGRSGNILVVYNTDEGNEMTTTQVSAAKGKGWTSNYYDGSNWKGYAGSAPTLVGIAINETNFPDEKFRNWILSQEYGQDGVLTDEEIADVMSIKVSYSDIQSLKGLEYFTELEYLFCQGNQLKSLDLSKNTKLTYLNCGSNQLKSLDLSGCTAMTELWCFENQLISLDVSCCTALTFMNCYANQLISLDVSCCTALESMNSSSNKMTTLNISGCTELQLLNCSENQLTSLDASNNPVLESLQCSNNNLTSLDVTNTAMVYIECFQNQINGAAMDAFVKGLPQITSGKEWDGLMYIVTSEDEGNVMTNTQVAVAKAKGWNPHYYDGKEWVPYADIKPVLRGDVNEDGVVNGTDIQEVINIIVNAD